MNCKIIWNSNLFIYFSIELCDENGQKTTTIGPSAAKRDENRAILARAYRTCAEQQQLESIAETELSANKFDAVERRNGQTIPFDRQRIETRFIGTSAQRCRRYRAWQFILTYSLTVNNNRAPHSSILDTPFDFDCFIFSSQFHCWTSYFFFIQTVNQFSFAKTTKKATKNKSQVQLNQW